jgi:diaminopimelate epimerase
VVKDDLVHRGASLLAGVSDGKRGRGGRLGAGELAKYEALGNDYLVVDAERFGARLGAARVRALCDRHRGVGSDGVLAVGRSRRADVGLRIFNPDGSEAERSGNGLRIAARFAFEAGHVRRPRFSIETRAGVVPAEIELRAGRIGGVRVGLGRARFDARAIPMLGVPGEVVGELLAVGGRGLRVTGVSLGNPHCVVFVRELVAEELRELGPRIETHRRFPRRTNVQLARVRSRRRIDVLVWERGAGETLASGTSAAAAAAAALKNGLVERSVAVHMPGGRLDVAIDEGWEVALRGPATPVFRARLC